jgi:hypothetical protein
MVRSAKFVDSSVRSSVKNWQELTDQVQRLIRDDSRFAAIRLAKAARRETPAIEAEALTDSSAQ